MFINMVHIGAVVGPERLIVTFNLTKKYMVLMVSIRFSKGQRIVGPDWRVLNLLGDFERAG